MRKIFDVYLARADTPYSEAYADLDLPASPYVLLDALDKLRLDEGEALYLQINEYYDFEELAPLLSGDAGLYELNALAQKLSELDERQQVSFKGLVQMEVNKKQGLIPTSRLIDLAYSADCCYVADALNDAQLGRFYAENGFVEEMEQLPDKVFELLDFEKIGREARIGEGGVFTEKGYVVQHTELNEAFQTLELTLKQPDYQILMELTDGGFLELPQTALPDTPPRRCLDCRIPLLSGALDSVKDIEILNGFAEKLSTMTGKEILRYKAVLTATECGDLQSAVSLLDNLDHYMLDTKISTPESAALAKLNFMVDGKDVERLQRYVNLPAYGRDLLEQDNAVITPYGRMDRDDFQPMAATFQKPALGGMEMLQMNCIERLNTLPATAQEKAWLEERLATLSGKESLVLDAAILRSPPESASEAINHLLRLEDYEVCCPAGSYEELGRFYLRSETTLPESLYPFNDLNQLGRNYENAHPGLFVGNAYVCYPTGEPDFHYNGSNLESCVDNDWSVKLKLASQHTPDGVWLRLPDYEELNDGKPDEIRIALDALGVEHIDECTLLEAKCILPEIGDLTQQYDRISDLVYDGQNLGFVLDERGQGMRNFLELYAAALEYEDCSRL